MRKVKNLFIILLVLFAVSTQIFATAERESSPGTDIIKSDDAAAWAAQAGEGKTNFSFVVFGDDRGTSPGRPLPSVLNSMLGDMGLIHPDFIVNTGDFMVGYTDTPKQIQEEIQSFLKRIYDNTGSNIPFVFAPGNHEESSDDANALFTNYFGKKLYYDFTYGNSHFIMINTNFPESMLQEGQKYGFFDVNDNQHTLAQVPWTQKALKEQASHTFVSGHVPVFSALSPDFGSHPKSFGTKENRNLLLNMLVDKGIDAYFSGHEHIFYAQKQGQSLFFTIGGGGAPLYGTTTGGYNINKGEGPDYSTTTTDSQFENGGRASGYHYDLHLPAGGLSIFSYMLVTVNGDKVSYDLLVPESFEVTYTKGNDGISMDASAIAANRTPFTRTLNGVMFLMPYSERGYSVTGTQIDWGRKESPAKVQPKILEVQKIDNYFAKVRVGVEVPASYSITVDLQAK